MSQAEEQLPAAKASITSKPNPGRLFRRTFWATIIGLAILTLALTVIGSLRSGSVKVPDFVEKLLPPPSYDIPDNVVGNAVKTAAESARQSQVDRLDSELNKLFKPAYDAIPAYASFHYSVLGEYTELGAVALGKMSDQIEKRLFAGLDGRVVAMSADLDQGFKRVFKEVFDREIATHVESLGRRVEISQDSISVRDDVLSRMKVTAPLAGVAAIGSAAAVKPVAMAVAKKLAAKTAAKAASKGVVKSTGVLGSAGTGAAVCSPGGPVASVACAVGAGLIGWFAVDAAVINLAEFFNRDEFEAEMRTLVDEQRNKLRIAVTNALSRRAEETADFTFREVSDAARDANAKN